MAYLGLVLSGILYGGVVFFAKILSELGADLWEIILYTSFLVVVLTAFMARHDIRLVFGQSLKFKLLLVASMLLVNIGQYAPLYMGVSVTLVVLLLYLQPVWTALIERFYFRRPVSLQSWGLLFCMLIGLLFLINPVGELSYSWSGIVWALLGGIGLSLWILTTQAMSMKGISPWVTFWACYWYTLLPCSLLYLAMRLMFPETAELQLGLNLSGRLWAAFLGYVVVILTLPNILLYRNNRKIPANVIGMILLLEPVTGILLDVVFLGQQLTWNIVVGGLIILTANLLLIRHTSSCEGKCKTLLPSSRQKQRQNSALLR